MSAIQRTKKVRYKDIPGHTGYRAGTDGSVWSCWKRISVGLGSHVLGEQWAELKPTPKKTGRRKVSLLRGNTKDVGPLILLTFVGPCPEGMQCCHENGKCDDDRLDNLRWGTPTSNAMDKHGHGTMLFGESHPRRKLTEKAVREMRAAHANGESLRAIGQKFSVNYTQVSRIVQRKQWAHVR